jgi:hypothetical protein
MSRWRFRAWVASAILLFCCLLSATAGSFRGVIVRGPDQRPGWIWVQGAHGALRQVEVSRAHVVYDKSVPAGQRQRQPEKSIRAGVEVRVTADQDGNGEWRALKVEILRIGSAAKTAARPPGIADALPRSADQSAR